MRRERISENVYVFVSEQYAQVTASAMLTERGAVLIDTLLYPSETREIKAFIEERLHTPVMYVINTHYHADHTSGTWLFPNAQVISHALCFNLLDTLGRESLLDAQRTFAEFSGAEVILPQLVFKDRVLRLDFGDVHLRLWQTPGHSPDSIVCLLEEERILFAADTLMGVPHFVDGDYNALIGSMRSLQHNNFEIIVQGHGDILMKGEIEPKITSDLAYMKSVLHYVSAALKLPDATALTYLDSIGVERCGKSRLLLNGTVRDLHRANMRALYHTLADARAKASTAEAEVEKTAKPGA